MSGVQELSVASHPADALSVFRAVADRLKATFGGSQQSLCKSPQEARIGTTCTPPSSPSGKGMCSSSLDSSFNVNAAVPFRRCYSGSTGLPDLPHECDLEDDWDEHDLSGSPSMSWPHEDVLEQKLTEVKELYRHRFGVDLDEDSDSVSSTAEFECDTDGTPWTKIEGTGTLTFAKLEAELEAAKCLFQAKYAETFSDCDSEPASESENASMGEGIEEKEVRDADGTLWLKTQGTGPLTLSKLEQDLPEVKSLYAAAFGQDVDDEDTDQQELDSDGTLWLKTQGTGPLTLSKLEQDLLEVKSLYAAAFGQDVDDEDADQQELDSDGALWLKTQGTGLLTLSKLEQDLLEVKSLYAAAFGQDVDDEDADQQELDSDGTLWLKTQGTGPLTLGRLEQDLLEVKSLHATAFGQDVDDEDANQQELDSDGTLWLKTQGTGPLTLSKLEQDLLEVKSLYAN